MKLFFAQQLAKVSMYPHLVGNVIISVNTGFLCFPL